MDRFAGTSAATIAARAVAAGEHAFGSRWTPDRLAIAPGRIELLGNHIDYNGGPVLAAAIDRFIAIASAREPGAETRLRAVAADAGDKTTVELDAARLLEWRNRVRPPGWADYVRGTLAALQVPEPAREAAWRQGRLPLSLAIAGDVPVGFGVSSSAALCVALALSLTDAVQSPEQTVLLAQEAEHRAGTPCGTMDQSASVAGGVIAFDGATLAVERLSPRLGDLVFAVASSGVERSLGSSAYPIRVAESREALKLARRALDAELPHLAALTTEQLAMLEREQALPATLAKRTRHVVEETARVNAGRAAMAAADWATFGNLMTASGHSSATLYEISHPDVESLVAFALQIDGVLGARMMGGGEGGTALILLPQDAVPALNADLRSRYHGPRGMADRESLVHTCAFAPGATALSAAELAEFAESA